MRGGIARVDNCPEHIGTYDTSEEAVLAYERTKLSIAENPNASTDPTTETPSEAGPSTDAKAGVSCKKRKHRSYIGVVINKRQKFVAQIYIHNEQKKLGTYDTPEEAAHAFDRAVIERQLPSSLLNYPATEGGSSTSGAIKQDDERNWNHWFETYCTKTTCDNQCASRGHKGCERTNQVQMRHKAQNSWLNYCKKHELPQKDLRKRRPKGSSPTAHIKTFRSDFEEKLRAKMAGLYHKSTGRSKVEYYDHLVFKVGVL